MLTDDEITDALAQLDSEVGVTEARLRQAEAAVAAAVTALSAARARREGADAFLALVGQRPSVLNGSEPALRPRGHRRAASSAAGLTAVLRTTAERSKGATMTIDSLLAEPEVSDLSPTREQVRNAMAYLLRKGIVDSAARGAWKLTNTSAPASTGAEVGGEPTSGSPLLEGDRDEDPAHFLGSEPLALEALSGSRQEGEGAAIGG